MTNKIRDLDIKLDIISKLLDAIEKYPDERIGQIIYNSVAQELDIWDIADTFYIEDKAMLRCINKRIKHLE